MKKMILLLILLVLITGCYNMNYSISEEVNAEITRTEFITPRNGSLIYVENINGNVDICRSDMDKIRIEVRKTTSENAAELDKAKLKIEDKKDKIFIKTEYLDKKAKVFTHYKIELPESVILKSAELINGYLKIKNIKGKESELECVNGNIKVTSFTGSLSAKCINGNIKIKDTVKINELESVNGSIKADIIEVTDDMEIETTNGSINLYISDRADVKIDAETSNGSVKNKHNGLKIETDKKRKLKAFAGQGKYDLEVSTTSGNISLKEL